MAHVPTPTMEVNHPIMSRKLLYHLLLVRRNRDLHSRSVHQDIKPQNILVKSKEGGSRYDSVFGLADLGTSSSAKRESRTGSQDNFGTKTYGNTEHLSTVAEHVLTLCQ